MTIPTRQAPPPPINQHQNRTFAASARSNHSEQKSRYTPTTDWDDQPFNDDAWGQTTTNQQRKKVAPPRPPPPKIKPGTTMAAKPNTLKKPSTLHSNTILSNLIGRAKLSKPKQAPLAAKLATPQVPSNTTATAFGQIKSSPSFTSSNASTPSYAADKQLISFDSPPGSPTFTQKSNSDCVSVDSFSSDSNYSPNNGFSTESGFEDDFILDNFKPYKRMTPVDPFDLLDDVVTPVSTKPDVAPKPVNIGNASFYTATTKAVNVMDETLCNGKNLISAPVARTGPTIIRAVVKKQPAPKPVVVAPVVTVDVVPEREGSDESETPPSPPMPSFAPPPPPKEYFEPTDETASAESYGIALYAFEGEADGDLPFREGEKIYLVRRVNDEWLFGRNRRGCEGIFPANFVDVKVPLPVESHSRGSTPASCDAVQDVYARALYDFNAETADDLTLRVNDKIKILYAINEEWIVGEIGDRQGQFPANYIDYL